MDRATPRSTDAPDRPGHAAVGSRLPLAPAGGPRRWIVVAAGVVAVLVLLAVALDAALDEPLRRRMEAALNQSLKGYHVAIGRMDLHVFRFAWDLEDVTVVQSRHPTPPVARIEAIRASVHWRALLHGRLVADIAVERPTLHVALANVREEMADATPVQDRGWQDAVVQLHPLAIDAFRVRDGDVTYVDEAGFPPLRLTDLHVLVENIRNVRSRPGTLPSPVHVDALLQQAATLRFDGDADLLARPAAAVDGWAALHGLPLAPLVTTGHHVGLLFHAGTLDADGRVAVAPDGRVRVDLRQGLVHGPRVDWVQDAAGAEKTAQATETAARGTARAQGDAVTVRAQDFRVTDGTIGVAAQRTDPPWRVAITGLDVEARDFSTRPGDPPGTARVRGAVDGSGTLKVDVRVAPPAKGPDFHAAVAIENVALKTRNDLLRATGGFDVAAGTFSFWSEVTVRDGRIDGYAKPFFADIDVLDAQQDRDEGLLQQAWEGIVGGAATVLSNKRRETVATATDLSGPVDDPQASTWQILVRLVQNAFVRAILPGLERARGGD